MESSARDSEENFGLVIRYLAEGSVSRTSTYSIRNKTIYAASEGATAGDTDHREEAKLLAIKALRKDLIRVFDVEPRSPKIEMTSRMKIDSIVQQLRNVCEDIGATTESDETFVTSEAIISLADAKKGSGVLNRLKHDLKVIDLLHPVLSSPLIV